MWQSGLTNSTFTNQPLSIHCANLWILSKQIFPFWIENMHQTPSVLLSPFSLVLAVALNFPLQSLLFTSYIFNFFVFVCLFVCFLSISQALSLPLSSREVICCLLPPISTIVSFLLFSTENHFYCLLSHLFLN